MGAQQITGSSTIRKGVCANMATERVFKPTNGAAATNCWF